MCVKLYRQYIFLCLCAAHCTFHEVHEGGNHKGGRFMREVHEAGSRRGREGGSEVGRLQSHQAVQHQEYIIRTLSHKGLSMTPVSF